MADPDSAFLAGLARAIRDLEHFVLTVLFLSLVGLGLAQIGMRNFGGSALPWADGAMRAIVLWLAMVGAVVATGRLRHIRIDLIERLLPGPWLVWLRRPVFAATALVCLALTWTSLDIVALEYEFRAVAFLNVPTWAVQSIVPIGFGIMAARFLAWALHPPKGPLHPAEGGEGKW
ncbi:MAG: TRAP transporter small permease subunit [Gammaproteobacteria bacterium]|nr:TRAP transporter small permease subunit [Gammaproteobacteria bacterium]